jgi:hypothetical protein
MTTRPHYYPISALRRDHYGVLFPIGPLRLRSGEVIPAAEVAGFRKTYRRGYANERVVYRVKRPDGSTEDLPEHLTPTQFRPANLDRYPDPLPEPAALTAENIHWRSYHPAPAPPDEREDLVWPAAAYSEPGKISEREAEVRILRAWKTQRSSDVDAKGLGGPMGYRAGRSFGAMEIRIVTWEATRRDAGDWPVAMAWFTRLRNPDHKRVIELRSMDFSFRQIGERQKKGVTPAYASEWARTTYRRAITEITAVANRARRGATR